MRRHEDIYCRECGYERKQILVEPSDMPRCAKCPATMRIDFSSWDHAPATDVLGVEQVSNVLCEPGSSEPLRYTSTRERDAKMAAQGCAPAGDKEGGARNESHLGLGKIYSDGRSREKSSRIRSSSRRGANHGSRSTGSL